MFEKDCALLSLMLETIEKIFLFTSDLSGTDEFEKDIESFDATILNFITLGECISKISNELRNSNPHIEWGKIYAFRNVIAHDYFGILSEEVWEIIKKDLPILKNDISDLLGKQSL
jgi:uncharacterized protein with HEPN domain